MWATLSELERHWMLGRKPERFSHLSLVSASRRRANESSHVPMTAARCHLRSCVEVLFARERDLLLHPARDPALTGLALRTIGLTLPGITVEHR